MKILDVFRRRPKPDGRKSVLEAFLLGADAPALSVRGDYTSNAAAGYTTNPYVYRAVELIASSAAGINWYVSREDGEAVTGTPLEALWARPNPAQSRSEFLKTAIAHLLLSGNIYALRVGAERRPPSEVYLLRPDRVKRQNGAGGIAQRFEYHSDAGSAVYTPDQLLHIKTYNPFDDSAGISPLMAARASIEGNNAAREWNVGLLKNNTRPSGVLSLEGNLLPEQRERLQGELERRLQGRNAGRPLVLEGGMAWQQIGLDASEISWLEGMQLSAREVALVFGVPAVLLGDNEVATYSNYQTARRSLYTETVLPLLDWLRDEFNRFLSPAFSGLQLAYDTDNVEALSEDVTPLWERTIKAVQAGILSTNEAREALGYGPATETVQASERVNLERKIRQDILAAEWVAVETKREDYYSAVERQIQSAFSQEQDALEVALDNGADLGGLLGVIDGRKSQWGAILEAAYRTIAEEFAAELEAELAKSEYGLELKAAWLDRINEWLRNELPKQAQSIVDTSKNAIRNLWERVRGNRDEAKAGVAETYEAHRGGRSQTIATTTTANASNLGRHAVAESAATKPKKTWVGTLDDRIRDAHRGANNQSRNVDEPFIVGGARLMFPGDSSLGAPASQTINCRCSVFYEFGG